MFRFRYTPCQFQNIQFLITKILYLYIKSGIWWLYIYLCLTKHVYIKHNMTTLQTENVGGFKNIYRNLINTYPNTASI